MKLKSVATLLILSLPLTEAVQAESSFDVDLQSVISVGAAQPPSCTDNYRKAFQLFKSGKGIDLSRVPEFEASFSGVTSNNKFVSRRGSIYLNMNINDQLKIEVPLTVCLAETAEGKELTAKIVTSKAVDPGTTQPNEMVMSAIEDPEKGIPRQITITVVKTDDQVVFKGTEVDFEASASIR